MAKKSAVQKGYRKYHGKKPYLSRNEIIALCVIVVAVIVGGVLLATYDDGALKVADGKVVTGGDNWLLVNGSPTAGRARYYKVAEMGEAEGYTRTAEALQSDGNLMEYVYTPDAEDAACDTVTVVASHATAEKQASGNVRTLQALTDAELSEVLRGEADGTPYVYYTMITEPAEEEADTEASEAAAEPAAADADAATETEDADAAESAEEAAEVDAAEPATDAAESDAAETQAEAAEDAEAGKTEAEDAEAVCTKYVRMMVDCSHDSCVIVEARASAETREALPEDGALLEEAEKMLKVVALEKED